MKKIYLDYAATTPVDKRVVKKMLPYLTEKFGNPASLHFFGQEASQALETARRQIAGFLNAHPEEIIFTSSATESNNLALKGIAWANKNKGKHLIISLVEHDCVLGAAKWLENEGFVIDYVPVDKFGLVDPEKIKKLIKKDTILVSVMHANNEIGTVQPIREIGKICREKGVYFHTDAVQTFGKISIDVEKDNLDLLTASSHKMYGPKGVALLYVKSGIKLTPLLHGGGQEADRRSSTVNVAGIVGFNQAVFLCQKEMEKEKVRLAGLRDYLISGISKNIKESFLNGHPSKRLPNNVNIRFFGVEGEGLLMLLDAAGIAASTGSACSSRTLQPSHVLLACGLNPGLIHGSLRFSLGRWTTKEEIDYVLKVLPGIVRKLRNISPFGKGER